MVGQNVAATQLVTEQAPYKISKFVYFTYAIPFTVNDHDEHVNVCTNVCCFRYV